MRPAPPPPVSTAYCFDRFEVRPVERRLLVDGQPAPVGVRAFDLLQTLVENPGRLVTKNELLDRVWPGLVVEEANVHVQISALRKLLGPNMITTVPGLGYRLAAAVKDAAAQAALAPTQSPPAESASPVAVPTAWLGETLIGRDADLQAIANLMARHRLVTIVGPGGIGKTRLARAIASERAGTCRHGVWWVDLAALRSAEQVAPAIAQAGGLSLGEGDADALLARALAQREALVVFDNCEHLVRAVARAAHAIVEGAPGIRVLATSQEALKVRAEQRYRLDGLTVPPQNVPLDAARCFDALRLLEQRAQAADRRFALTESTVGSAIELCRRLDGSPLAIEMAAARLPALGFEALLQRLGESLRWLSNATRHAPQRQQSLRATLDWSHALLSDAERSVFASLSVFAASFRLEAALAVASAEGLDEWAVLDALEGLVDKSLLHVVRADPPRYRMRETTRLYAAERLHAAGATAAAQVRHGQAMAALALEAEAAYWTAPDRQWLAQYADDYDDWRLAFEQACTSGDASIAAATGMALFVHDRLRQSTTWRRVRLRAAHALLPYADALARARLWSLLANTAAGVIEEVSRDAAAREMAAAWRGLGEAQRLFDALCRLADVAAMRGDWAAADSALAEARSLERPDWPPRLRERFALHAAHVSSHRGDAQAYKTALRHLIEVTESAGFDASAMVGRNGLADAALQAGDVEEAIVSGERAVALARQLDMSQAIGIALANLCAALLVAGRTGAARDAAARALPVLQVNHYAGLLTTHLALLAAQLARWAEAAALLGAADRWYADEQRQREPNEARLKALAAERIGAALGPAELARLRKDGAGLTQAQVEALVAPWLGSGSDVR